MHNLGIHVKEFEFYFKGLGSKGNNMVILAPVS